MTIRSSAYNTTASGSVVISKNIDHLKSITSGMQEGPKDVFAVTGNNSFQEGIPTFIFPLVDEDYSDKRVFIDMRPFGSYDLNSDTFKVRQVEQCEALRLQGSLALSWARDRQAAIEYMSPLPIAIFVTWLGEALAKRVNLTGRDQYIVTIIAAILYNNNFRNSPLEVDEDKNVLFNTVTRTLRYNDTGVNQMLINEYGWVSDVNDFCKACYEATQSVALKNVNPSILFTLTGGSMWGSHAAEKLAVALEYPPTWITILYQIITDRSYKGRCQLSTITERAMYKKYKEDFVRQCLVCMEGAI